MKTLEEIKLESDKEIYKENEKEKFIKNKKFSLEITDDITSQIINSDFPFFQYQEIDFFCFNSRIISQNIIVTDEEKAKWIPLYHCDHQKLSLRTNFESCLDCYNEFNDEIVSLPSNYNIEREFPNFSNCFNNHCFFCKKEILKIEILTNNSRSSFIYHIYPTRKIISYLIFFGKREFSEFFNENEISELIYSDFCCFSCLSIVWHFNRDLFDIGITSKNTNSFPTNSVLNLNFDKKNYEKFYSNFLKGNIEEWSDFNLIKYLTNQIIPSEEERVLLIERKREFREIIKLIDKESEKKENLEIIRILRQIAIKDMNNEKLNLKIIDKINKFVREENQRLFGYNYKYVWMIN